MFKNCDLSPTLPLQKKKKVIDNACVMFRDISSAFVLNMPVEKNILIKLFLCFLPHYNVRVGSTQDHSLHTSRGLLSSWSPKWALWSTFHQKQIWPVFIKLHPFSLPLQFSLNLQCLKDVIDAICVMLCDKGMDYT